MKHAIALSLFVLSSVAFAEDFKTEIFIQGFFKPTAEKIYTLTESCQKAAPQVEENLKSLAAKNGVELDDLVVSPQVLDGKSKSDPFSYCQIFISGSASKSLEFDWKVKRVNHLKLKGYAEEDFSKACDGLAETFSSNPDELFQVREVDVAMVNGNFCSVSSTVLNIK